MAIKLATSTSSSNPKSTQIFDTFRGIDMLHSQIDVETYRATDMRNFIMENGANTKRFGWQEYYRFENDINGIWTLDTSYPITDDLGNIISYKTDSVVIVHSGKKIYTINNFADEPKTNNIVEYVEINKGKIKEIKLQTDIVIENKKSYAYVSGNRLYIMCGSYVVFGKWKTTEKWTGEEEYEVRSVYNDVDTFIPTCVTKIVCEGSEYLNQETPFSTNIALDDRNVLTDRMKLTLLGEDSLSSKQENLKYLLNVGFTITSIEEVTANGTRLKESEYSFETEGTNQYIILNKNYVPLVSGVDNITVTISYANPSANLINECRFGCVFGYKGLRDRLFVSGNPKYPNMLWHSTESNVSDEIDFTYFSEQDYIKLGNTNNSIMGMYIQADGTMAVLKSPSSQEPTIYFIQATLTEATDYTGQVVTGLDGETLYEESYPVTIGSIGVGLKKVNGIYSLNGDPLMVSEDGIYGIVLGDNATSQQRYAKLRSRLIDPALANIENLENTAAICFKNKFYFADTSTGLCYIADARYPTQLNDELSNTYQYEWWVWDDIYARLFFEYKENLYFASTSKQICIFKRKTYKDVSYKEIQAGSVTYDKDKKLFVMDKDNDILKINSWAEYEKLHNNDSLTFNDKINLKILLCNANKLIVDEDGWINYICDDITKVEEYEKYTDFKTSLILIQNDILTEENATTGNYIPIYLDEINGENKNILSTVEYIVKDVQEIGSGLSTKIRFRISTVRQSVENPKSYISLNRCSNPFRLSLDMPTELAITNLQDFSGKYFFDKTIHSTDGNWYQYDDYGNLIQIDTNERPNFNYFELSSFLTNNQSVQIVDYNNRSADLSIESLAVFNANNQIKAYYYTTWFNLGSDVYLKNLNSVYVVPDPIAANEVRFAFQTKRKEKEFSSYTGKQFDFNNLDFNDVTFGNEEKPSVFQKKFKTKKFSYIRFIFKNENDNNCKLARVTIEYQQSTKVKGEK